MECPNCKGTGAIMALVDGPHKHGMGAIRCFPCKGTGYVAAMYKDRVARGIELRNAREMRGESLGDAARKLGILVTALSYLERGGRLKFHVGHRCNEERCNICEGGLALCIVCLGGEITLPTECPGRVMTNEENDLVRAGKLDFTNGEWVHK